MIHSAKYFSVAVAERQPHWQLVPGVEVLLYQALDQFELWTASAAPVEVMAVEVSVHIQGTRLGMSNSDRKLRHTDSQQGCSIGFQV